MMMWSKKMRLKRKLAVKFATEQSWIVTNSPVRVVALRITLVSRKIVVALSVTKTIVRLRPAIVRNSECWIGVNVRALCIAKDAIVDGTLN